MDRRRAAMGTAGSGVVDDRRPLNGVSGGRTKGVVLVKESPRRRQGDRRDGVHSSRVGWEVVNSWGPSSRQGRRKPSPVSCSWKECGVSERAPGPGTGSFDRWRPRPLFVARVFRRSWWARWEGLAGSRNMLGGGQGFALLAQPGYGWRPGPTEARVVGAPLQAITRQLLPA